MIQPLDTSRSSWRLICIDLEEPVPKKPSVLMPQDEVQFYLPTCLLVTTAAGHAICPPEILEEPDQLRAEQLLGRLFDLHGTPDRLTISSDCDWDTEAWRGFALDCRIEIHFGALPSKKTEQMRQALRGVAQRLQPGTLPSSTIVARGLVASARGLRSPEKRLAHLRKAIEQDAGCSEARIEIADGDYQAGRWTECRHGYQDIIDREEKRLQGEDVEWWVDAETRPYLRALYGRAMTQWQQGGFAETAADLGRLLRLNPADNQGVRFLMPLVHLLGENDEAAMAAITEYESKYPEDYCEPALLFGQGLAYWRSGSEEKAKHTYSAAMLKNLYIAPMLLDLPLPPADLWHPNDRSEPVYAQDFIQSYATLWERDPASLRCLREIHAKLTPTIAQVIALRRRMSEWQDQRYTRDFKRQWKEMTDLDESLTGSPER